MSRPEHHQHAVELDEAIPPQTPGDGSEGVREDILDEINDHLNCAMQREMRRTDDPHAAWSAVLHRFGDPRTVARQLWYLAMKETIMLQRTLIITNIITAIAVIVLGVILYYTMERARDMNQAILAQLQNMPAPAQTPPAATDGETISPWTSAEIVVRSSVNEEPFEGVECTLQGDAYNAAETVSLSAFTDASGKLRFGPIRPGKYWISARREGVSQSKEVIIAPGDPSKHELTLAPPFSPTTPVALDVQIAEDLQEKIPVITLELQPLNSGELSDWQWQPVSVVLNPRGGAILRDDIITEDRRWRGFDFDIPLGTAVYPEQIDFSEQVKLDPRFRYQVDELTFYYPMDEVGHENANAQLSINRSYRRSIEIYENAASSMLKDLKPLDPNSIDSVYQITIPEEVEKELRERINQ